MTGVASDTQGQSQHTSSSSATLVDHVPSVTQQLQEACDEPIIKGTCYIMLKRNPVASSNMAGAMRCTVARSNSKRRWPIYSGTGVRTSSTLLGYMPAFVSTALRRVGATVRRAHLVACTTAQLGPHSVVVEGQLQVFVRLNRAAHLSRCLVAVAALRSHCSNMVGFIATQAPQIIAPLSSTSTDAGEVEPCRTMLAAIRRVSDEVQRELSRAWLVRAVKLPTPPTPTSATTPETRHELRQMEELCYVHGIATDAASMLVEAKVLVQVVTEGGQRLAFSDLACEWLTSLQRLCLCGTSLQMAVLSDAGVLKSPPYTFTRAHTYTCVQSATQLKQLRTARTWLEAVRIAIAEPPSAAQFGRLWGYMVGRACGVSCSALAAPPYGLAYLAVLLLRSSSNPGCAATQPL